MSNFSNAGTYKAYPLAVVADEAFTGDGFAFSVAIINNTGAPITAGSIQFQGASDLDSDPCTVNPATWADIMVAPACDGPVGAIATIAGITLSATQPLPARSQCHLSWPCNLRFVRLKAAPPAGIQVVALVTQLRNQ